VESRGGTGRYTYELATSRCKEKGNIIFVKAVKVPCTVLPYDRVVTAVYLEDETNLLDQNCVWDGLAMMMK
jgi:hypothetical protein